MTIIYWSGERSDADSLYSRNLFVWFFPVLDTGFEHKLYVNVHLALLDFSNLLSNTLAMTLQYKLD